MKSVKISYSNTNPEQYRCAMPNCSYSCNYGGYRGRFVTYEGREYCNDCIEILKRLRVMARWS